MPSRARMLLVAGAIAMLASTGCIKREKPFRATAEVLLPKPVHSHPWVQEGGAKYFDATTLEDYINGGARPYLEYGMVRLIHAVYRHKAGPKRQMLVDVYEMVSPLAAYGIFSILRPEEAEDVRIGTSGFWSDGLLCFVKNRIFVSIQPPGEGPRDMASAILIAGYIDQHTSLPAEPPEMLEAIPAENRIRNSEKYLAANMLGYRFLGAGWLATYRHRGVEHGLFVIPCEDSAKALERYEKLAETVEKTGRIIRRIKGVGRSALVGTGESFGRVFVTCGGKYLVGTTDCFDDDQSAKLSRQVLETIAKMGI